jgi:hypothetical protein
VNLVEIRVAGGPGSRGRRDRDEPGPEVLIDRSAGLSLNELAVDDVDDGGGGRGDEESVLGHW